MATDSDGVPIKVGEYISWKGDIEMSGRVASVIGDTVRVTWEDGETGQTMTNVVHSKRCWHE